MVVAEISKHQPYQGFILMIIDFFSAAGYIRQFITAAKIISVVRDDYLYQNHEVLVEYLKHSTKQELHLFRNSFYSLKGYVF